MGLPSVGSPRLKNHGDHDSLASSEECISCDSASRRKKGFFPEIGSRWRRSQSDDTDNSRTQATSSVKMGLLRGLFSTTPRSNADDDSPIGFLSNRGGRPKLDPIAVSQLQSAKGFATLRSNMLNNRWTSQQKLTMDIMDSPIYDLVPGKLGFTSFETDDHGETFMTHRQDLCFHTSDLHSTYGPDGLSMNVGAIFRFWENMQMASEYQKSRGRKLVYYSRNQDRSSACFLLASYMVLEYKMSTSDVIQKLQTALSISHLPSGITLGECLGALQKAVEHQWFDVESFNVDDYETLGNPAGGGLSCFGRDFVVFPTPTDANNKNGRRSSFSTTFYSNMLQRMGTTAVVRINDPTSYDTIPFSQRRMRHYDLTFEDLPTKTTVKHFLDICDSSHGLVGVHGIDGMGGSCTLVCLWMMKHLGFTAREAIAWVRLVRPGAVLRRQEDFLYDAEDGGWNENWLKSEVIRADNTEDPAEGNKDMVLHWTRQPRAQ